MKKSNKIIALCLSFVLLFAAVGGTLAYLTSQDSQTNVFTAGYVKITLNEQEREYNKDGELVGLKKFTDNKVLVPTTGSAQGTKDKYGMPIAENYVDKIVTVTNDGNTDAYIRVIVGVPAALESDKSESAAYNVLHWNYGNKFTADGNYDITAVGSDQPENPAWADVTCQHTGDTTVDDIEYNLYTFTYTKPIAAGKTTEAAAFTGFYLDQEVNTEADEYGKLWYTYNGKKIEYDLDKNVNILVAAEAVQAAGFASAEAAFEASKLPANPFDQ